MFSNKISILRFARERESIALICPKDDKASVGEKTTLVSTDGSLLFYYFKDTHKTDVTLRVIRVSDMKEWQHSPMVVDELASLSVSLDHKLMAFAEPSALITTVMAFSENPEVICQLDGVASRCFITNENLLTFDIEDGDYVYRLHSVVSGDREIVAFKSGQRFYLFSADTGKIIFVTEVQEKPFQSTISEITIMDAQKLLSGEVRPVFQHAFDSSADWIQLIAKDIIYSSGDHISRAAMVSERKLSEKWVKTREQIRTDAGIIASDFGSEKPMFTTLSPCKKFIALMINRHVVVLSVQNGNVLYIYNAEIEREQYDDKWCAPKWILHSGGRLGIVLNKAPYPFAQNNFFGPAILYPNVLNTDTRRKRRAAR